MKILNKKAVSIIEFSLLFIIVIGAFLIMKGYIQRGIYGKWQEAGKTMAFGRQYDPQKTIECSFDDQSNQWYDRNCFNFYTNNRACGTDADCQESIINSTICSASSCTQLNNGASV
jgi:hypothetical protein